MFPYMDSDTATLRVNQIVRYTDPDGNQMDAIIDVIDGDAVMIKFKHIAVTLYRWVPRHMIEVPR